MNDTRQVRERRGGARDDKCDNVTINMTRDELIIHLQRIKRKCEILILKHKIKS